MSSTMPRTRTPVSSTPDIMPRRRLLLAMAALVLLVLLTMPVSGHADKSDRDRARQALLDGKVLSLRDVLEKVTQEFPGEPIEIEFDEDDGVYVYEIKLLQQSGSVLKLEVDASSGDITSIKGRDIRRQDRTGVRD